MAQGPRGLPWGTPGKCLPVMRRVGSALKTTKMGWRRQSIALLVQEHVARGLQGGRPQASTTLLPCSPVPLHVVTGQHPCPEHHLVASALGGQ